MQKKSITEVRNPLLFCLFILGLMTALVVLPSQFRSEAGSKGKGLLQRTESHVPGLENYDIRADKSAFEKIAQFRQSSGKDAAAVADLRENFVRGEENSALQRSDFESRIQFGYSHTRSYCARCQTRSQLSDFLIRRKSGRNSP